MDAGAAVTVADILNDCMRRLNYGTFDTTLTALTSIRLFAYANEVHRELLALPGLETLRDDQITLAATALQQRFALPSIVGRVLAVTDRTNQIVLRELTPAEIRRRNPGLLVTGLPAAFARTGSTACVTPPAIGATLTVVSSAAGDTSQTVTIHAVRSAGYTAVVATTLNGTTPVTIAGSTDFVDLTRIYVSGACVGDVTIARSGTTYAVIPIGQTFARYTAILLDPIPASAYTYVIDFTREIRDFSATGLDEPWLPQDFHRLLGIGIRMHEYEKSGDTRYETIAAEYGAGKAALRSWAQTDGTNLLSLRRRAADRPSQLGAYYPANT